MITISEIKANTKGGNYIAELRGLSTDTKPTEGINNGCVFIEIDTGKLYMYDEENEQWKEI